MTAGLSEPRRHTTGRARGHSAHVEVLYDFSSLILVGFCVYSSLTQSVGENFPIGFHRLCALLRFSPKSDATSNNFFGLLERHVTGVELLFPVTAGAIELGDFKRAGGG
jgi:hypothetical protein